MYGTTTTQTIDLPINDKRYRIERKVVDKQLSMGTKEVITITVFDSPGKDLVDWLTQESVHATRMQSQRKKTMQDISQRVLEVLDVLRKNN